MNNWYKNQNIWKNCYYFYSYYIYKDKYNQAFIEFYYKQKWFFFLYLLPDCFIWKSSSIFLLLYPPSFLLTPWMRVCHRRMASWFELLLCYVYFDI